jgi:hypothetical protein
MTTFVKEEPFFAEKCARCVEPLLMTEEHVFAESAGGVLVAHILCGACNAKLGRNIDEPFLRHPLVQIKRHEFNIGGRRSNIPQPYAGPHTVQGPFGDAQIKLDAELNTVALPIAGEIAVLEDGRLASNFSVDQQDRDKLPGIIKSKFERFFKSDAGLALRWSAEDQQYAIQLTIERNMASAVQETPIGPIKMEFRGKLEPLLLEAAKVAYEIAYIEGGENYLLSGEGEEFRSLLKRAALGEIVGCDTYEDMCHAFHVIPTLPNSLLITSLSQMTEGRLDRCHVAIRQGTDVLVSMFGHITLFAEAFPESTNSVAYLNDCVEGTVGVLRL